MIRFSFITHFSGNWRIGQGLVEQGGTDFRDISQEAVAVVKKGDDANDVSRCGEKKE